MASLFRPHMLRQLQKAVSVQRSLTIVAFNGTHPVVSKAPGSPSSVLSNDSLIRSPSLFRKSSPIVLQVAPFHSSPRRPILPPLPQRIQGTANDPALIPPVSPTHGSYHWAFERAIAVTLIPLTAAPFIGGSLNPIMDATLCAFILVHSHIGFEACIIDYFPYKRVPKFRAFCNWLLRAATLGVAVGLYEFETNDVGVTEAIKRIWSA
ncbi:MAG: membrane anchor subunit of succinate dehydrogenase, Sdh4 [Icmadophila ericetorum]|nr:membrane anchor subunit of succinate dehydrogenase, Sdh4 [Icmadophila ericetorum]